jgi:hypothetical protein
MFSAMTRYYRLLAHGRITLLVVFSLSGFALNALAQSSQAPQKSLTIESSNIQPPVALGRPMLTWWDVKIPGSALVVGKFQFAIKSDNFLFATLETEELTLNGPEQRIRVLLPPVDCAQSVDRLYVDISFQGKKYSGPLGQQILRVPFTTKTVFMGLIGESRLGKKRSVRREKIMERLRFESLIPETTNLAGETKELVKTIFASIDPNDFPTEPLAYCGYDVVILLDVEFRNLRKPQLEGLLSWVQGGGSLFIEPNGVLEPYHLDFLRKLTEEDRSGLVIQVDPAGKLPLDSTPSGTAPVAIDSGLGSVVMRIVDPHEPIDDSPEAWQTVIKALWKFRFQSADRKVISFIEGGLDGLPVQKTVDSPDPYGFDQTLYNAESLKGDLLLNHLTPTGVQIVPLWLLAMILIAFVCLIGPGEYFGLGLLRARKLTWITFPLATIGVTSLTVWLSNRYMTAGETRQSIEICDLGSRGELIRTNRFELLFVASTHSVLTEVEKGVFVPLRTNQRQQSNVNLPVAATFGNPGMGGVGTNEDGQVRPMPNQAQGRIPTQFVARQNLVKWTPQINRIMSIPGAASVPQIDWTQFELGKNEVQFLESHVIPPEFVRRIQAQLGLEALVACFMGHHRWAADGSPAWRSAREASNSQDNLWIMQQQMIQMQQQANWAQQMQSGNSRRPVDVSLAYQPDLFRWIHQASIPSAELGQFALSRQTTPKGGRRGDDLVLLDPSDANTWLLAIVVPKNDGWILYRKRMRFRDLAGN